MITINDLSFTNEFFGDTLPAKKNKFIMGAIMSRLTAWINFSIHWESLQTYIEFNSSNKTMTRTDNVSWIDLGFREGDTFTLVGSTNAGNYTIASITDDTITTVESIVNTVNFSPCDVHGTTPINAIDLFFNVIKNSDVNSFLSLTDYDTNQKITGGEYSWTTGDTINLIPNDNGVNSIGWYIPMLATVTKQSVSGFYQNFTIQQLFFIQPFFITGEQVGLNDPLQPPSRFRDINSVKYICQIQGRFAPQNPVVVHISDPDFNFLPGNVGWFNEHLNGGTPEYTLNFTKYTDALTSAVIPKADFSRDCIITMELNSANGKFIQLPTDGATKFTLNFGLCPLNENVYKDTSTNFIQNFIYDRHLGVFNESSANGDNFGTTWQAITGILSQVDTPNLAIVSFTLSLSDEIKQFLANQDVNDRNYIIWLEIQDPTRQYMFNQDGNAILGDFQNFDYDQREPNLIQYPKDIQFYEYPDITTNAYTDYKGFLQDQILSKSFFKVKRNTKLLNASVTLQAWNDSQQTGFTLEQFNFSFDGQYTTQDWICKPQTQTRNFQLAADDPRNRVDFFWNPAYDDVNYKGYEIDYGFMFRYEEWREVDQFDQAFTCDHSQNWSIYSLADGWQVRFLLNTSVQDGDNITNFERIANIEIKDSSYSNDGVGTISAVKQTSFFDGVSYNNIDGAILKDQITHVKYTLTGNFSSFPAGYNGYYGILRFDNDPNGGYTFIDSTTSEEDPLSSSVWMNRVTLTKVNSTTITLEADLDPTKLQNFDNYLITLKFGFKNT